MWDPVGRERRGEQAPKEVGDVPSDETENKYKAVEREAGFGVTK